MRTSETCRTFISYARSDGADHAARLRHRLEKEYPEIELFQDVISLHSGTDWWLEITRALNTVDYMVLVATPGALASDAVRKEWRYARQQGVCVLPVLGSDPIDMESLPRWMRTKHFADLEIKQQWELFIADLHRPYEMLRVPFMAEDLPKDYVPRPAEFEPLIRLLLDEEIREQRNPIALTTALRGAGGFGKTTLAKAVCHDERIQEVFDDGVLWITLGEKVDNLIGKLTELTSVLSGEPASFTNKEAAGARLRELLADRDILMVIDDVWDFAHLEPFLQGGPYCARLMTTRNLDTLPPRCRDVTVDSMQAEEASALLGAGLPAECKAEIVALAKRTGNWPLLLGIVNGVLRERVDKMHQPLSDGIAYANKALDKRGLTAFDPRNTEARNRAVELTLDVSLENFVFAQRERLNELSVFPEDVEIPLKTVGTLWRATAGLDDFDAEELCVQLHRHSLLQMLDLTTRQLRLHDVMRSYLQTALARRADPKVVHEKLIGAWGDPLKLSEAYAWRWYAYHLRAAGKETEFRELLRSPEWLQAKLAATDITSLTADFDRVPKDEELTLVRDAIRLSSHVVAKDPQQFASQMIGRLLPLRDAAGIQHFMDRIATSVSSPWLRPLHPALYPPGGALLRTLESHSKYVEAVSVTPDGKRAVSASRDNTLKVWDLESGVELRTLEGHSKYVGGVAVMLDGKRAVSASQDDTLKVWDLESGVVLRTLKGHIGAVNAVAVTLDGKRAVSAGWDRTMKVWDLESGAVLRTLKGHFDSVNGVAVTPDGKWAVSASKDDTLKVWDLESGVVLRTLKGHIGSVNDAVVTRDGKRAVSAGWDRTLKVWDIENGVVLHTLKGHSRSVGSVAVTSDGTRVVSSSEDETLMVWDLESGVALRTLKGHFSHVTGVAVTPDGKLAVSASWDGTLKVWDLESGVALRTPEGHSSWVTSVAVTPNGKLAVSASKDNTLKVWDPDSGMALRTLKGHASFVTGVATPEGKRVVSASYDLTLQVWDLESGAALRTLRGHSSVVTSVAVTPDGKLAVSASRDRTLKVWDLESGVTLRTLKGHSHWVTGVAVTPDGKRAVSASIDDTLKVWDLESGVALRTLEQHSNFVTGEAMAPDDFVNGVAMTADGKRAVSASHDGIKVWDLESGVALRTLKGHSSWVSCVAMTANGERAVSAAWDKTLKVWDMEAGEVSATFTCDARVVCCTLSGDDNLIVAGDDGGRIHFLRFEGQVPKE